MGPHIGWGLALSVIGCDHGCHLLGIKGLYILKTNLITVNREIGSIIQTKPTESYIPMQS